MTQLTNMPQITYRQKNEFVTERSNFWGAMTEGIEPGHKRHGIILGFDDNVSDKIKSRCVILKCFEENGNTITVIGCKSLACQLHVEQDYPFTTLVYNVGDVVCITFEGSFISNKGVSAGKMIANYRVNEVCGYELTEQDRRDIQKYQNEQLAKKPMGQFQRIQVPQNNNQFQQPQQQYGQQFQQPPVNYATPAALSQYNQGFVQQPQYQQQQQYRPQQVPTSQNFIVNPVQNENMNDVPTFAAPKPVFKPADKTENYEY